ncbi:zf-HC2 domain-containing protein [Shouchella rhizosphaerae]|uniref:zf-HC2 domain-containing protein n=1 Tax=Shouchella rhizosphaerae TaxID=866786 RepID=UPI000919AE5B|nr:zf-HC2 domain-containing protein [Shouchella rhizosphaerae]MCM3311826.1 zf-HC2 domain-containing protein [Psychrobacillus sp. MER TA 17]SHL64688.1 Putative zinc-finger [Shouchella rhizosphaerae]
MKHSVFKDLAPAYIDKLTSEETNEQIEKHMDQCEECRNYLNKMKGDLFSEDENERRKDKRNIDYFKKVRSKNRKKILVIVSSLLAMFFVLITAYYFVFVNMWLTNSSNVETNIQNQGMMATLLFKAKKDNHYIILTDAKTDEGYTDTIVVYEKRDDFSTPAKLLKNGSGITFTFADENTLLLYNGKEKKLTDEDKVTIQYKDKTDVIPIKDLYDKNNDAE